MIRSTVKIVLLVTGVLLLGQSSSWAWRAATHYQLGVESGGDPGRRFQMLPDSWPSHSYFPPSVTKWFAWSHATQRTGSRNLVPNVPIYPKDDRNAGEEMYDLYQNGIATGSDAYDTALGFLAHNAQDRQVHYRYFRGGSIPAWHEEHAYKEWWADCWIYRLKMKGRFNKKGDPLDIPPIANDGNTALISKAQENFILSGKSTHSGHQETITRESESKIQSRLSKSLRESKKYLVNDIREPHCRWLVQFAKRYAWTLDELEAAYEESLKATRDIISAHPR